MSTIELTTNTATWDHVLEVMSREMPVLENGWTLDIGQGRPEAIRTTHKSVRRVAARRHVIWSRVLLPLLALACAGAYFSNNGLEKQYQQDRQAIYSHLGP